MPLCPLAWERIGASDMIMDWITNGIKMYFNCVPDAAVFDNPAFNDAENMFVGAEIDKLLVQGVVKRVTEMQRCVSPLKVSPLLWPSATTKSKKKRQMASKCVYFNLFVR